MGSSERRWVNGGLGHPDTAVTLKLGHSPAQVGIDQPVASRHGTSVVEQRGICNHDRSPVVVRDGHVEGALGRAAEQLGHRFGLSGRQGCAGSATDKQCPAGSRGGGPSALAALAPAATIEQEEHHHCERGQEALEQGPARGFEQVNRLRFGHFDLAGA